LLALGVFRGYPAARSKAAVEFVDRGFTVRDLDRLQGEVNLHRAKHPSAVLAAWLKDDDGQLEQRILELRAEVRSKSMNTHRQQQLEYLDQAGRRDAALAAVRAYFTDGAALADAVKYASAEFELDNPLTRQEAEADEEVQRIQRGPADWARAAIDAMVARAKKEVAAT
jgi:hypothetical protein